MGSTNGSCEAATGQSCSSFWTEVTNAPSDAFHFRQDVLILSLVFLLQYHRKSNSFYSLLFYKYNLIPTVYKHHKHQLRPILDLIDMLLPSLCYSPIIVNRSRLVYLST